MTKRYKHEHYCKIQTYNFTIFSSISSFHSQILKSALKNRWQHPYTAVYDNSERQLVISNHSPKGRHLDTYTISKNKEFKKDSLQNSATQEVALTYSGGGGLNQSLPNKKRLRMCIGLPINCRSLFHGFYPSHHLESKTTN